MISKQELYHALVTRNPEIEKKYNGMRKQHKGKALPWLYLAGANIKGLMAPKRMGERQTTVYAVAKKLPENGSESISANILPHEELVKQLSQYDVVSLDVFDTLIFRTFGAPKDLFFVVGHKLHYFDYKRIRTEAEKKARMHKFAKEKHYEVTLAEICEVLGQDTGLDKTEVARAEWEVEQQCCFANPYMKKVIEALIQAGKHIIITSDTYFGETQIRQLLEKCGYSQFTAYYISSDMGKSKSKGDVYDEIKRCEGANKTYIHVGDNHIADVEQAKKKGFATYAYSNVNEKGAEFRTEDISTIVGSIYSGIVNAHIYNGLNRYSKEYEYGYIYGGLFVVGYCQYINVYVHMNSIDKILFLSRDGEILLKAYERIYSKQKDTSAYMYWSRLAALKLGARYYKGEYFQKLLYDKVDQNYHLQDILSVMDIGGLTKVIYKESKMLPTDKLTNKNVDVLKSILDKYWQQILDIYANQSKLGNQYFSKLIGSAKKMVVVDAGWAGTGEIFLHHIEKKEWDLKCKITGLVAGTLAESSLYADANETFLRSGELTSYMFSQSKNRDLWKLHSQSRGHNLLWELLMTSTEGSFQGFHEEQGDVAMKFGKNLVDATKIDDIHEGILDFVKDYNNLPQTVKELFIIDGRDAYAPMLNVVDEANKEFVAGLTKIMDNPVIS